MQSVQTWNYFSESCHLRVIESAVKYLCRFTIVTRPGVDVVHKLGKEVAEMGHHKGCISREGENARRYMHYCIQQCIVQ